MSELETQELEVQEIQDLEVQDSVLKVFVYNTKGEKIREDVYASFIEIYDYVLEHNSQTPEDPYNIYPGTSFPPKGYKWNNEVGDWVEINLFEKWQRGEVDIPIDCKIVNNIIVRKNLTDLYEDGLIHLPPDKKINKELNIIIQKNEQEMIDEGLLDWEGVYARLYNEFKNKLDHYIDMYYFKYPKNILMILREKVEIAKKWIMLSNEDKAVEKSFNFLNFQLLISEFTNRNVYLTLDQIEDQLDELCHRLVKKNNEIENKMNNINAFFEQLYAEIEEIKEKKNYLLLMDFVYSVDNKILKWIKS